MADRVGVIDNGRIVLVEDKAALMRKLGKRRLTLALQEPLPALPQELAGWPLELEDDGNRLSYRFDAAADDTGVPTLSASAHRDRRRLQGSRHQRDNARGYLRRSRGTGGVTFAAST